MAQLDTSIIFYSQAVKQLQGLQDKYGYGISNVDSFLEDLRGVLTQFEQSVGTPLTDYDPVADTEPPLSDKYNRFINGLQADINILQYQYDVLRSSAVVTHNLIATEIARSKAENIRVSNKAKTLQLYSDAVDSSIITFGDYFQNDEFLDADIVPVLERAYIPSPGYLILGQVGPIENLSTTATVTILEGSNGFSGNLHEVVKSSDQATATDQQASINSPESQFIFLESVTFKAESNDRALIDNLLDGEPNTWFEYENWLVSASERSKAHNFDFAYQQINPVTNKVEQVDWASGPSGGSLKLGLQFDLKAVVTINSISLIPFNLDDNANFALHVVEVRTSQNGTDWDLVKPSEIYVGTTPNIKTAIGSDNIYSAALWTFPGRPVRYVSVLIEQKSPIPRDMGHIYYVDDNGERAQGPIAPLNDPTRYYDPNNYASNQLIQKREIMPSQRWVIGLKDLTIARAEYAETSYTVTKLLRIGGIVDRVSLDADIEIPAEFSNDQSWVSFYVSPNNGKDWFQISRIQDDFQGIPEILAFNDPTAAEFQESGVGYEDVDQVVKDLRLKIVLSRPSDMPSATPIVKSFKLKVKTR